MKGRAYEEIRHHVGVLRRAALHRQPTELQTCSLQPRISRPSPTENLCDLIASLENSRTLYKYIGKNNENEPPIILNWICLTVWKYWSTC